MNQPLDKALEPEDPAHRKLDDLVHHQEEYRRQRRQGQDEAGRDQRLTPRRPGDLRDFLTHFPGELDGIDLGQNSGFLL